MAAPGTCPGTAASLGQAGQREVGLWSSYFKPPGEGGSRSAQPGRGHLFSGTPGRRGCLEVEVKKKNLKTLFLVPPGVWEASPARERLPTWG